MNSVTPVELNEDEIDLLDLLAVLIRHKKMIIVFSTSVMLIVLLYAFISLKLSPEKSYLPNEYTSTAYMLINSPSGSSGSDALSSMGLGNLASLAGISAGGVNYGTLAGRFMEMRSFQDKIISKFDLLERYSIIESPKTNSRITLKAHLTSEYEAETGIFSISYNDINSAFSTLVANYAVDLLEKQFQIVNSDKNLQKKEQLEQKIYDIESEVQNLEKAIQDYQEKYGFVSMENLATEQITTFAQVRSELIMKDIEIKTYRDLSNIEDPKIHKLQIERNNLSQLLDELQKGSNEYESLLPSQNDLPKIALEFAHLKRDLKVQEAIYSYLTQQYESVKLLISTNDPIFQVLEKAEIPDRKSGPSRGKLVIIVTMAGFFMSIFFAFILEFIRNLRQDKLRVAKLKDAWTGTEYGIRA